MNKIFLDAGTTFSKILTFEPLKELNDFLVTKNCEKYYYIIPSATLNNYDIEFEKATGHMSLCSNVQIPFENEIIALANGAKDFIEDNSIVLDVGSRDVKGVK